MIASNKCTKSLAFKSSYVSDQTQKYWDEYTELGIKIAQLREKKLRSTDEKLSEDDQQRLQNFENRRKKLEKEWAKY